MAEICVQLPCKTGVIAGKSCAYQANQRYWLTPFRYVSVVFLHSGMIKKIKMLTKKLSQTLARDYFFVIFAWSLRQRVHLHHETF